MLYSNIWMSFALRNFFVICEVVISYIILKPFFLQCTHGILYIFYPNKLKWKRSLPTFILNWHINPFCKTYYLISLCEFGLGIAAARSLHRKTAFYIFINFNLSLGCWLYSTYLQYWVNEKFADKLYKLFQFPFTCKCVT